MVNKIFDIRLDIKQLTVIQELARVTQADNSTNVMNIRLFDGEEEINYTLVESALIVFLKNDGTSVQGFLAPAGRGYTYTMGTAETAAPGAVVAAVLLYGELGERLTTARFRLQVDKDLLSAETIESTTQLDALSRLMELLEEKIQYLDGLLSDFDVARIDDELRKLNAETSRLDSAVAMLDTSVSGLDIAVSELDSSLLFLQTSTLVGTPIITGDDLDDYVDSGHYFAEADVVSTLANTPPDMAAAFTLNVATATEAGDRLQTLHALDGHAKYYRVYEPESDPPAWLPWVSRDLMVDAEVAAHGTAIIDIRKSVDSFIPNRYFLPKKNITCDIGDLQRVLDEDVPFYLNKDYEIHCNPGTYNGTINVIRRSGSGILIIYGGTGINDTHSVQKIYIDRCTIPVVELRGFNVTTTDGDAISVMGGSNASMSTMRIVASANNTGAYIAGSAFLQLYNSEISNKANAIYLTSNSRGEFFGITGSNNAVAIRSMYASVAHIRNALNNIATTMYTKSSGSLIINHDGTLL